MNARVLDRARLEARVIVSAAQDVDEIEFMVQPRPRRANRPVVLGALLVGRGPGLNDAAWRFKTGRPIVSTHPIALDHRAARGHGRLLILRRESVGSELRAYCCERRLRLPL